jgi:Uma2 family endonuclease
MARSATSSRAFRPGTTGWTAADLDDPHIERKWLRRSYEIIEGVLTRMPPAYFAGSGAVHKLAYRLTAFLESQSQPADLGPEVDIVIDEARVIKADYVYLTPGDKVRQAEAARAAGKTDPRRARLYVPPTLVIESLSPGHELHDERTKRRWYAEFGVPHYWLLNAFDRTLRCLVLESGAYRDDAFGREADEVRPAAFPGLVIPLGRVWAD